jgi:hypothetical protein
MQGRPKSQRLKQVQAYPCIHAVLNRVETEKWSCLHLLLPPWMVWPWLDAVPLSTIGSRRASAVREWHGMRQKASAVPDRTAAAAAREATDFIVATKVMVVYVELRMYLFGKRYSV